MNDNAKLWLDALRSKEFTQTKNTLRYKNSYCCLGVACVLYQNEIGDLAVERDDDGIYRYDRYRGALPPKVMDWLGLAEPLGDFCDGDDGDDGDDDAYDSLSSHNDSGESFEEIADLIESNPKGLFR